MSTYHCSKASYIGGNSGTGTARVWYAVRGAMVQWCDGAMVQWCIMCPYHCSKPSYICCNAGPGRTRVWYAVCACFLSMYHLNWYTKYFTSNL